MIKSARVSLVEYSPYEDFVNRACEVAGTTNEVIRRAVAVQGERIRRVLGLTSPPISLINDALTAEDVAGLVRLLPTLEIEIAPKFLGNAWPSWREDFLLVANIARSGQLLIREGIASSTGARDDLACLVAQTYVNLFDRNSRRPLRVYRPHHDEEWSLDGNVDSEDILMPGANGYRLERLALSGRNRYNAQMARAATLLSPEVRDGVLQRQVRRIGQRLGPQPASSARPRQQVPSRHRSWQQCYELANEINAGFGVRFAPGKYSSPGYVLTTWRAFEHMLVMAFRIGLSNSQISYHSRFELGQRSDGTHVVVEPDIVVRQETGDLAVFDAKYKGRAERAPRISASDLYEGLAFAEASGQNRVTLLYPRPTLDTDARPVGSIELFEEVRVGSRTVAGATIECRGLSTSGGFAQFSLRLAQLVGRPMSHS